MSAAEDFNPRALIPCERIRAEAFYVEIQSIKKTDRKHSENAEMEIREREREQTTQLEFKKSLYMSISKTRSFSAFYTSPYRHSKRAVRVLTYT